MPPKPNTQKQNVNKKEQEAINAANAVNDIESEENKKAMRQEIRRLKSETQDQTNFVTFYEKEREKLTIDWAILKKDLESKKSELINKEREFQDLKENHTMTINLYKQRVKHLLFQNQDQSSDLKKDVENTLKLIEDEHRIKERELKTDNRSLKIQAKEQEIGHKDYLFALKSEYDKNATNLRYKFEREFNDVKKKYELKMQKLRQECEDARNELITLAEDAKNKKIAELTKLHQQKYTAIKQYYTDITATNLTLIKQFKNEINDMQKQEDTAKKMLAQIYRQNQQLTEPLKMIEEEIKELTLQCKENDEVIKKKDKIKKEIEENEILFRKLEYEYEVKLQQYNYIKLENDKLQKKFNQDIYEIQQKIGLKNLILEKKLQAIQENLEIKDIELNQVLRAANIDPQQLNTLSHSLEEIDQMKSDIIGELESQLIQIRKAHAHMIKAYEGKLQEFVIPVEELGFDPLVPTNQD